MSKKRGLILALVACALALALLIVRQSDRVDVDAAPTTPTPDEAVAGAAGGEAFNDRVRLVAPIE